MCTVLTTGSLNIICIDCSNACYYYHHLTSISLVISAFGTGLRKMSAVEKSLENVKAVILSAHKSATLREKVNFYNSWAKNYEQV